MPKAQLRASSKRATVRCGNSSDTLSLTDAALLTGGATLVVCAVEPAGRKLGKGLSKLGSAIVTAANE